MDKFNLKVWCFCENLRVAAKNHYCLPQKLAGFRTIYS